MSLSRQSIALVLTTKNNQTQQYIHQKHKRETEKTALANKTILTLIWYGFYYLRSGNGVGPILTALEPTRGKRCKKYTYSQKTIKHLPKKSTITLIIATHDKQTSKLKHFYLATTQLQENGSAVIHATVLYIHQLLLAQQVHLPNHIPL